MLLVGDILAARDARQSWQAAAVRNGPCCGLLLKGLTVLSAHVCISRKGAHQKTFWPVLAQRTIRTPKAEAGIHELRHRTARAASRRSGPAPTNGRQRALAGHAYRGKERVALPCAGGRRRRAAEGWSARGGASKRPQPLDKVGRRGVRLPPCPAAHRTHATAGGQGCRGAARAQWGCGRAAKGPAAALDLSGFGGRPAHAAAQGPTWFAHSLPRALAGLRQAHARKHSKTG
jgi:hypothetical protein